MKLKYSLIIGLVSVVGFGQNKIEKGIDSSKIIVEYKNSNNEDVSKSIPFFVNGVKYPSSIIRTIKPEQIQSIDVLKESKEYPNAGVIVVLEKGVNLNLISLSELIRQETENHLDNSINIFFIDGEAVTFQSRDYLVDKNNILRIVVKPVKNADAKYNLVDIFTKSDKNINDLNNNKLN